MILGAYLVHLGVLLGAPLLLAAWGGRKGFWSRGWVAVGVHTAALGAASCLLYRIVPWGFGKWVLAELLAALVTLGVLKWARSRRSPFPSRTMILVTVMAVCFSWDVVAILGGQGWEFESKLFHRGETYFRPPMNNDLFRHTVVVAALLREAPSTPFLPGSQFAYQLFWHQLAGLTVAPLARVWDPPTLYPLVVAHGAALGSVFFFLLGLWAVLRRPSLFRRPWLPLGLGILALSHADLYHYLRSFLTLGRGGIEADWSAGDVVLRNFSLKLMALTAPQHLLFFLFLLGFLAAPDWIRRRQRLWFRGAMVVACVLASPLLSGFCFPLIAVVEWWRGVRRGEGARVFAFYGGAALVAVVAHFGVLRQNPLDLFLRPGASEVFWFPVSASLLVQFPLLWLAAAGPVGVLALAQLRDRRWGTPWAWVALLGALPLFTYIVTAGEIRRHYAMVVAFISVVLLVRQYTAVSRSWGRAVALGALACLPLQGYFLYAYLGKPSHLRPNLGWSDYWQMNRVVREKFPEMPVLAAVDAHTIGLEKPPVMEVTTSFSYSFHTLAHIKATPAQFDTLLRILRSAQPLPYGGGLGYQAFLWGPVEDLVWGSTQRARFVREENLLARVGSVSLYRWGDGLPRPEEGASADRWIDYGGRLAEAGFPFEALDQYRRVLEKGEGTTEVYLRAAKLLFLLKDYASVLHTTGQVLRVQPGQPDALQLRATALLHLGKVPEAIQTLRVALTSAPDDQRLRNNLGALLNRVGDYAGAEEQLRPLAELAGPIPIVWLNLAEALLGQQRYRDALVPLRRCLHECQDRGQRTQAHRALAAAYQGLHQFQKAMEHRAAAEAPTVAPPSSDRVPSGG